MRRVKVFIPMTLDNYVATEQGNLNWLNQVEGFQTHGYEKLYHSIDTVVLSRPMLEWLRTLPNVTFPYRHKTCYVLSRTQQPEQPHIQFIQQDVASFLAYLKEQNGGDIWLIGGGQLIRSALDAQLVDEVIVTIAPLLLGRGIPLFTGVLNTQHLALKEVETFGQFVEIRYEIVTHV